MKLVVHWEAFLEAVLCNLPGVHAMPKPSDRYWHMVITIEDAAFKIGQRGHVEVCRGGVARSINGILSRIALASHRVDNQRRSRIRCRCRLV